MILIGYGSIALFFLLIVYVLERTHQQSADFSDYAVAGRSFGSWFQTMAFLNTWLPGTIFIAFAGYSAAAGVAGYYVIGYSILATLFMFFMAERVFNWGHKYNLKTQSDFVGNRYQSNVVKVIAALIGVLSMFPWLVLAFQSMGLVFSYLSFGLVPPKVAVFIGIAVLSIRQYWTVRMGMRGIVISDMVQGIIAYGIGGVIALILIYRLLTEGFNFQALPKTFSTLPGFDSGVGGLYYFSIVATGALGSWCWPDIFVRLFTAKSAQTVRNSAVKAAPLMYIFLALLLTMSMLAHSYPGVADAPDNVWFIMAASMGPVVLSIAGVCVLAATIGNINAITAAIGTHASQDIIYYKGGDDKNVTRMAKIIVVIVTIAAVIGAVFTVNVTAGLLALALASYQGIVQLAPALYLGIFWKRATALGAALGMIAGFAIAFGSYFVYPVSIPWLAGITSGIAGLIVNVTILVVVSYLIPVSNNEKSHSDELFA